MHQHINSRYLADKTLCRRKIQQIEFHRLDIFTLPQRGQAVFITAKGIDLMVARQILNNRQPDTTGAAGYHRNRT
ncbi:hypothetical protein D3C80_1786400 [compost metagenome]